MTVSSGRQGKCEFTFTVNGRRETVRPSRGGEGNGRRRRDEVNRRRRRDEVNRRRRRDEVNRRRRRDEDIGCTTLSEGNRHVHDLGTSS